MPSLKFKVIDPSSVNIIVANVAKHAIAATRGCQRFDLWVAQRWTPRRFNFRISTQLIDHTQCDSRVDDSFNFRNCERIGFQRSEVNVDERGFGCWICRIVMNV